MQCRRANIYLPMSSTLLPCSESHINLIESFSSPTLPLLILDGCKDESWLLESTGYLVVLGTATSDSFDLLPSLGSVFESLAKVDIAVFAFWDPVSFPGPLFGLDFSLKPFVDVRSLTVLRTRATRPFAVQGCSGTDDMRGCSS